MKTQKKGVITALLLSLTLQSCNKEPQNQSAQNPMIFTADYSQMITKAGTETPFKNGNWASIIGFQTGASPSSATPVNGTPVNAECGETGVLTTDNELFLPKGNYDFYSTSLNNKEELQLSFTAGLSGQLKNGVDYLWAKNLNISAGSTVSFKYKHKAVAIEIITTGESGISDLNIKEIKITPSKPSASTKMSLIDGAITPCTSKDTSTPITVENNIGSYIMLPMTSNTISVVLIADLKIGGKSYQNKQYNATLPAIEYLGGTIYKVSLTINALKLTFNGSTVEDWTTQDVPAITLTEE